tara:strand:- start:115 stop:387 length:273 start_codon:yes stop_codon:yes gene_type:complete
MGTSPSRLVTSAVLNLQVERVERRAKARRNETIFNSSRVESRQSRKRRQGGIGRLKDVLAVNRDNSKEAGRKEKVQEADLRSAGVPRGDR